MKGLMHIRALKIESQKDSRFTGSGHRLDDLE